MTQSPNSLSHYTLVAFVHSSSMIPSIPFFDGQGDNFLPFHQWRSDWTQLLVISEVAFNLYVLLMLLSDGTPTAISGGFVIFEIDRVLYPHLFSFSFSCFFLARCYIFIYFGPVVCWVSILKCNGRHEMLLIFFWSFKSN